MTSFIIMNVFIFLFFLKSFLKDSKYKLCKKSIIFICLLTILLYACFWHNFLICLLLVILVLLVYFIKRRVNLKYINIKEVFKDMEINNANNECLITQYKKRVHENKNQMLIIKGLINDTERLNDYVNYLIEDENESSELISELNYLQMPGIRNFINSKINIISSLGADIELYISEELKNVSYPLNVEFANELYTILGVLFDNIIDSIKESNEKLVSILIYCDVNRVYFELANTHDGDIELDKINDCGYSTKGEGRGVGLNIVKNIINKSEIFNLCSFIVDDFFSQRLEIKINE